MFTASNSLPYQASNILELKLNPSERTSDMLSADIRHLIKNKILLVVRTKKSLVGAGTVKSMMANKNETYEQFAKPPTPSPNPTGF